MKKPLLFFMASILLIGCSKDDEPAIDPIVGQFRLVEASMDGESPELEICQQLFTMEFTILNTGAYTLYGDDQDTQCAVSAIADLDWQKKGDRYRITSEIPFFAGLSIPTNSAEATLKNNVLTIAFNYSGHDYGIVFQKTISQ
tara:strand:- start:895 stop:1323 length:429 start_codon:yes stop_codon:yes gene_type:complete